MSIDTHIPLPGFVEYSPDEMLRRAREFYDLVNRRRTVRDFDSRTVPKEVIEACLMAAGTAPSGANLQPWYFVAISDSATKQKIRAAAEAEEREFYSGRAGDEWLTAISHLGTNAEKPYLETAPYLIAVFARKFTQTDQGKQQRHYYVTESVGLATGILITALHNAGLATLTHTPSPMSFLNEILERPNEERPFVLLVTGYPANTATVPDISRKPLSEIAHFVEGKKE